MTEPKYCKLAGSSILSFGRNKTKQVSSSILISVKYYKIPRTVYVDYDLG